MKLQTERELIRGVAARWRSQYGISDTTYGKNKPAIGKALAELDPETATAADVAAIIGNNGWTSPETCSECCDESPRAVVQLGAEPDYESRTAYICRPCLVQALALIDGQATPPLRIHAV